MPKTIKLGSHLSSEELEYRYRKAHDPVLRSHYQIIWLISEGKTTRQVMEHTGYSRGWIQRLARRYNAVGPDEALGDRRHHNPGARDRALLSAEQQQELKEALKKPPPDGGM
jgi:transposase